MLGLVANQIAPAREWGSRPLLSAMSFPADKQDPAYRIVLTSRANKKHRTIAGVAFAGQFGSLNIVLNPGIIIDHNVMATCWINAIPYVRQDRYDAPSTDAAPAQQEADDDIPF